MIKVSVIIPCYNAVAYIDKCLENLIKDKLEEKEIILIDDGSTDETLNILKKYEKKYDFIKVKSIRNGGQGRARNEALKIAKGSYITFVDVDDFVAQNAITTLYDFAIKNNSDFVFCDYYFHYADDKNIIGKNNHSTDVRKNAVLANFSPWAKLISKKLIDEINFKFVEGKIFEDIGVIPYLAAKSKNPQYLEKTLYYYNMSNMNSTTRKRCYDKKYEDMFYISDNLFNLFKDNGLMDEYYDELKYIFLDSILKSGVLKFAKYKEGLKFIPKLRKNVLEKFDKLLNNKYFKNEPLYRKLTAFSSLYFPSCMLYLIKQVKK